MINMDPKNPIDEAREAIQQSNTDDAPPPSSPPPSGNNGQSRNNTPIIIGVVIAAVVLLLIGAFLPPFSLGDRLFGTGETETTAAETSSPTAESEMSEPTAESEAEVAEIPGEIAIDATGISSVSATPADQFAATSNLPAGATAVGNVYVLDGTGTGQVTINAAEGIQTNTDLLGYDGQTWQLVPAQVSADNQQFVTVNGNLPQALLVVNRTAPDTVAVVAEWMPEETIPAELLPYLTQVNVGGYMLGAGGELTATPADVPQGGYASYMNVTNAGVIVDQSALSELLADTALQEAHVQDIVAKAQEGDYAGVILDYEGLVPSQADDYTGFVATLSEALETAGINLAVFVSTPSQAADGQWSTAGQNLAELGPLADTILLRMPLDPTVYTEGGNADQLLAWATRQVDRQKLMPIVSAYAIDKLGNTHREIALEDALANLGDLVVQDIEGQIAEVEPGTAVTVSFSGEANPLEWDGESLTYKFSYDDNGETRTVWITNEAAVANRLRLIDKYGVNGAVISGLASVADTDGYAQALEHYTIDAEAPDPDSTAIVWTVKNEDGGVVASSSGEELEFTWSGAEDFGNYVIEASLAQGEFTNMLGFTEVVVGGALAEADEAPADTAEGSADETTEAEEEVVEASGDANAVVSRDANIRVGPGLGYGLVTGGAVTGTEVEVIGRSEDSQWFQLILPSGTEGWIFNTLIDINEDVQIAGLPVPTVEPPAQPVAQQPAPAEGGEPAAPAPSNPGSPPPPVAAANLGGGFELGGQTHSLANPQLMQSVGMNWVKFQHKWGCGNNPGDLAGRINQAHSAGFKVLLAIPGSPYPTNIEFECYVEFLRGVAALGPDGIEIWNEMNIDFEWPAGQIDPTSYVNNMLAPAYNAIKSTNPNVLVVGGALAPTGFDNGTNAWSDARYIEGMRAAGAANYMDCMGAHYNAGATSPTVSSGHPTGSGHYSWYFMPTLNLYASFGKPVCFTELGYLSGEGWGSLPPNFSWASNTSIGQHAQWLAEAVSMSANDGRVRMLIIFNVDFTLFDGADPQAGYGMVRKDGSCPSCDTIRAVMGR
jgi:hypothetical protein